MKQILFFFSTTDVGGAETNILKISRELTQEGYAVFWCSLENEGKLLDLVDFELKEYKCLGLYYKKPIEFLLSYRNYIIKNKIEVVLNFGLRVEIISRLFSKTFGVKKIISNIRSTDDWRKPYHSLLDRITSGAVDIWVSNSIAGKNAFIKREKIKKDKISVIYNFMENLKPDTEEKQKKSKVDKTLRIGILANITKEKGYYDAIKISQYITNKGVEHMFVFAGLDKTNGVFFEELKKSNVISNFKYLGYIKDKQSFFENIDVFFLPSYLEGMPTAMIEAMNADLPIVSTTVGGIPEIITDNYNGYLLTPGDYINMGNALISILEKKDFFLANSENVLLKFDKKRIISHWCTILSH